MFSTILYDSFVISPNNRSSSALKTLQSSNFVNFFFEFMSNLQSIAIQDENILEHTVVTVSTVVISKYNPDRTPQCRDNFIPRTVFLSHPCKRGCQFTTHIISVKVLTHLRVDTPVIVHPDNVSNSVQTLDTRICYRFQRDTMRIVLIVSQPQKESHFPQHQKALLQITEQSHVVWRQHINHLFQLFCPHIPVLYAAAWTCGVTLRSRT